MGHKEMIDGMIKDGLWDPYNNIHMGNCGEICAKANNFTREMMDEYTISTFTKAQNAYKNGLFNDEIVPTVGSAGTHSLLLTHLLTHSLTHSLTKVLQLQRMNSIKKQNLIRYQR